MNSTLHQETPLFLAHRLSAEQERSIYFKMDCYQPTGSFKIRGVGKRCQEAKAAGYQHFVIASGGNAGLATAYAGWKLKVPTTVVLPVKTSVAMQEKIRNLGATVKLAGQVWDEAHAVAIKLADSADAVYISPFDHPTLWEGHASVLAECATQMPEPDVIVVAVGGGGYFCGVMQGVAEQGWNKTRVLVAETKGANCLQVALEAGERVALKSIDSIASSLGAKQVAAQAFEYAQQDRVQTHVVTDGQALDAVGLFLEDIGTLVEPACGAALSAVYHPGTWLDDVSSVLVLVCGGAGMNLEKFQGYQATIQ
ncbi:MAG: pyridoxal-phosphate dependent enzyme [Aureispira sp.]